MYFLIPGIVSQVNRFLVDGNIGRAIEAFLAEYSEYEVLTAVESNELIEIARSQSEVKTTVALLEDIYNLQAVTVKELQATLVRDDGEFEFEIAELPRGAELIRTEPVSLPTPQPQAQTAIELNIFETVSNEVASTRAVLELERLEIPSLFLGRVLPAPNGEFEFSTTELPRGVELTRVEGARLPIASVSQIAEAAEVRRIEIATLRVSTTRSTPYISYCQVTSAIANLPGVAIYLSQTATSWARHLRRTDIINSPGLLEIGTSLLPYHPLYVGGISRNAVELVGVAVGLLPLPLPNGSISNAEYYSYIEPVSFEVSGCDRGIREISRFESAWGEVKSTTALLEDIYNLQAVTVKELQSTLYRDNGEFEFEIADLPRGAELIRVEATSLPTPQSEMNSAVELNILEAIQAEVATRVSVIEIERLEIPSRFLNRLLPFKDGEFEFLVADLPIAIELIRVEAAFKPPANQRNIEDANLISILEPVLEAVNGLNTAAEISLLNLPVDDELKFTGLIEIDFDSLYIAERSLNLIRYCSSFALKDYAAESAITKPVF